MTKYTFWSLCYYCFFYILGSGPNNPGVNFLKLLLSFTVDQICRSSEQIWCPNEKELLLRTKTRLYWIWAVVSLFFGHLLDHCTAKKKKIVVFCFFSFTLVWSYHNGSIQLLSPAATMLCLCPLAYLTEISGLSQMKNAAFFFEGRHGPNENRLQEWKYEAWAKILNLMEGEKKADYTDIVITRLWRFLLGKTWEKCLCSLSDPLKSSGKWNKWTNWMYLNMGKLVPNIPSGRDSERTADSRSSSMTELGLGVPSLLLIEDVPSFLSGKNSQGTSHAPSGFSSGDFCLASNVTTNLRSCVRFGWRG